MGYTVRVSNISQNATERDIYDFFAFSGEISSIQTRPDANVPGTQEAFVTFLEGRSLETALLLTGAVISERPVSVELAEGYQPPATSQASSYAVEGDNPAKQAANSAETLKKAEGMMASLLASGYILSKDAMDKARALDEKHDISTKAKLQAESISKSAAELDSKYEISKKLAETSASVSRSWSTVDEKYRISTKSKEALTAAEASLTEAGQYVMQNRYVSSGASWLMGALGQLKTIAAEVQQQAAEKVNKAEEERIIGRREHASSLVEEDDEQERRANTAPGPGSLGLSDHGPPLGGAPAPAAPSADATSLMDAPLQAAAAPKPSVPSVDPPIF